mmetsp:Transcript_26823/g.54653  ORF Transcript_26823/g.54653 Transcript_26823/m.54653 type:complete len:96 (+) Transcript_26823:111-398(+)
MQEQDQQQILFTIEETGTKPFTNASERRVSMNQHPEQSARKMNQPQEEEEEEEELELELEECSGASLQACADEVALSDSQSAASSGRGSQSSDWR